MQHSLDLVLFDVEGRQLVSESLYLYGCMLLLLDLRIPGVARERMIVSYYRYKGASTIINLDEVCKLCRATGYTTQGKRPGSYPEEYFGRIKIPRGVVESVVARLRSDDIYNLRMAYPKPEHRSTALATQSAMLYVILYFAPHILTGNESTMREIVDKHFSDNWVVAFYMGFAVDLSQAWEPYRAARIALKLTDEALRKGLPSPDRTADLNEAERAAVRRALTQTGGNVSAAAAVLGLSRATLNRKLKRLELVRGREFH